MELTRRLATLTVVILLIAAEQSSAFEQVVGYRAVEGDCVGSDISSSKPGTAEECGGYCTAKAACKGWVYVSASTKPWNNPTCFLKSSMCDKPSPIPGLNITTYYKIHPVEVPDYRAVLGDCMGNDISSSTPGSPEECGAYCTTIPACAGWVYVSASKKPWTQPTCHLKRLMCDKPSVIPGVSLATYYKTRHVDVPDYRAVVGDCFGNDMPPSTPGTPEECAARCASTPTCAGWVYVTAGTKPRPNTPCHLKSLMCDNPSLVSGLTITTYYKTRHVEVPDYRAVVGDCFGNDMPPSTRGTPEECAARCASTPTCAGWVYVTAGTKPQPNPPCHLKNLMCDNPSPLPGFTITTYYKTRHVEVPSYRAVVGDCAGNDMPPTTQGTPEDCAAHCTSTPTCVGWVYVTAGTRPQPNPPCHLKRLMCDNPSVVLGLTITSYYKTRHVDVPGYRAVEGDCAGNDMPPTTRGTPQDCAARCTLTPGCVGWVYVTAGTRPQPNPPCHLKRLMCDNPSPVPGWRTTSYYKIPPVEVPGYRAVVGDCAGSDISSSTRRTPEDCATHCTSTPTCVGWVYVTAGTKPWSYPPCHLKSSMCDKPSLVPGLLITTYYMSPPLAVADYTAVIGDCAGNDVAPATQGTPEECGANCTSRAVCAGWVYVVAGTTPWPYPPCHLKTLMCDKPSRVAGLSITSYFKTRAREGPYRVQSFNYPSSKFGVSDIIDEAPVAIMDGGRRFFIHQPGLTGINGTVSFEAADWPGHYLRHRDTYLYIKLKGPDGFAQSATFKIHSNLMNTGYYSFEAFDKPGFYIRHAYYKLRLQESDDSPLFKADSSFRFQEGPYLMQAENMKDHVMGVKGIEAYMVKEPGVLLNYIHPGLTGQADTVSVESHNQPGLYLRHYEFKVDLENRTNARNASVFDPDSVYKLCKSDCFLPGYVTLEAVSWPGRYLRHAYWRVSIDNNDNSELFKHDASFKFINAPSYMEAHDLPGYKIDTSTPANIQATTTGQELLLVYPGLTNQPGTVSIEVLQDRGTYLCVAADLNITASDGAGDNQTTFKQQVTFFLRDSPWIADTLVFESAVTPASYIARSDFNFKLQEFKDLSSFKSSASFVRGSRPLLGTLTSIGPFRVQSLNYPTMRFGVSNIIEEAPVTIMDGGRRFFIHQPGLTGANDTISFEAADWPGHYLRHRNTYLYVNLKGLDGFSEAATFKMHTNLMNSGYYTFEAVDLPGFYIRHAYYKLRLQKTDNSTLFKADSSFRFLEGPYLMQSENMQNYVLGVNGNNEGYMVNNNGLTINYVHPGLNGEADTLSMESHEQPGAYIRHYELSVDLENRTDARYAENFDTDSTFKLCKTDCLLPGYVAFEAVNWPGKFVRHSNYRVIISDNDNSDLFKHDASFKYINTPSYLESYNYPGYRMDTSTPANIQATTTGQELLLVYPGLTNQPGTVSIEVLQDRGKYLRVAADLNITASDGAGEDADTFNQQATFYLRDSSWIANTLAFESVSTKGSYITRLKFNFKLQPFQDTESFKSSSSFLRSTRPPMGTVTDLAASLIQSYNYPHDHTFGFSFGESDMYIVTNGRRFIIRSPGLTGQNNSVSLLSADRPGTYLRKSDGFLVTASRFDPKNPLTYLQEATFIPQRDKWFAGYFVLESAAVKGTYIRHDGYRLFVSPNDNSDIFKADASFRRIEGPYLLQSLNYPQNKVGLSAAKEAAMTHSGHPWYFIHPGLSNDNGSISLQSSLDGNSFLRHYGYLLDLEDEDNPRNPGIFKYDASFYLRRGKFYDDYLALEPVNQPNHFVRHANDRVRTSISDNSELLKKDASFRAAQGPYLLSSFNTEGYGLSVDSRGQLYLGYGGVQLQFIYPGLTGQVGTVSLEIANHPGIYLRHSSYFLRADKLADTNNPSLFKADATWWVREEEFFKDTLILESVNYPSYYVRHENLRFRISKFQDLSNFKKDASFKRIVRVAAPSTSLSKGPFLVQSLNYPKYRFGVDNILDEAPASITKGGRRFFIHQPGLTGANNTVSFEAADWPGHYLRHRDNFLYILVNGTEGSNETATFKIHTDLMNKGYHTFEAVDKPGYYIRHSSYNLRIDKSDNSPLFKADSSFRFLEGPYLMQSENMQNYVLGVNGKNEGYMVNNNGLVVNFVHPGLTAEADTVSLESQDQPGAYMRHFNFKIDLENRTDSRNPISFDQEATFKLCKADCFVSGYISLEAVNFPGRYLRHANFRVMMSINDNTPLFKHDSSFKFINTPSYLESYNYPGYRMDTSTPANIQATTTGQELLLVYPGLTNQPGTVSIEVVENRGKYLRATPQGLAVSDGSGEDQGTFRQQASFFLRDSPWFANTLAFESVYNSGNYITRVNFNFKLQPFQDTEGFKSSSSLSRSSRPPVGRVADSDPSLIQSYNYLNYTFGYDFGSSDMYIKTDGRRLIIRSPGLTGKPNSVSFLLSDRKNTYLRSSGGFLVTESRFNPENPLAYMEEATFIPRMDKWFNGYFGLESAAVADEFISHSGYRLYVSKNDNSDLFKADASFRRIEGPYLLQSLNYPQNKLGLSAAKEAAMTHYGHPWYFVHPGLSNNTGSISLESSVHRHSYLRHYNYLLDLEDKDNPRNPGVFKYDASFYLRRGKFYNDYFALEPVNQANHFVRHSNDRVRTSISDNSELLKKDASFRAAQGPYLLSSYNKEGYGLSVDNQGLFYLGSGGVQLQFIFPGLTGQIGTVSVEIVNQPGFYLRHASFLLRANKLADSNNQNLFKADATWWLREDESFKDTLILESVNFPNYYVRHENSRLKISQFLDTDSFKKDASFKRIVPATAPVITIGKGPFRVQSFNYPKYKFGISTKSDEAPALITEGGRRFFTHQPGLTGVDGTVSFETADWPGHYLRHRNNFLYVKVNGTDGFSEAATFKIHTDLMNKGYHTFEAVDKPGYYIRHSSYKLRIDKSDNSPLFKSDSSFRFLEGPYLMQSENMQNYVLGVNRNNEGYMVNKNGLLVNLVNPGLTGGNDTVSLESQNEPGAYMRHFSFKVDLEKRTSSRNPISFDQEATYKLCRSDCYVPQYISLEAVNFPGRYLRHSNFRVMMSTNDNTPLFKHDASFKFIDTPSYLESYNYPGYRMDTSTPANIQATTTGQELLLVYPGLTNQPGTVSIEVVQDRGMYLRATSEQKLAVSNGFREDQDTFKLQASFLLRDSPWFANTLAFESVAIKGSYISRVEFRFELKPYADLSSFKSSSSLIRNSRAPLGNATDVEASLFQSNNYPNHTFGLNFGDTNVYIKTKGNRFTIKSPGLTGQAGTISFLSPDRPNTYLRQNGGNIGAESRFDPQNPTTFLAQATFMPRQDKWFTGYFGFESVTTPDWFIRHSGYRLFMSKTDNSQLFKMDASFRRIEGPYLLQSRNYPEHKIGLNPIKEATMTDHGHPWYFIYPGLSNDNGSLSLQSSVQRNSYLRHYNSLIDMEDKDNPRNPGIFNKDASFYVRQAKFYAHYYSLESVNQAGYYVRHLDNRLTISTDDRSLSLAQDASWRSAQGPFLLGSYNMKGYMLSVNQKGTFYIGNGGVEFQFIVPGLTGQIGTVSVEIANLPEYYIRHSSYLLRADDLADNLDNEDLFRADATWWVREELFFENTLCLESVNYPGYYLRHENWQLKISKVTDEDLFKQDASFIKLTPNKTSPAFIDKGPYRVQSLNYPTYKFGVTAITDEAPASIMKGGRRFMIHQPGLTGANDTVSFEAADWPGHYLRHRDSFLFVDIKQISEDFDETATFTIHTDLMTKGYFTFEAVNQPGFYIRHKGYKLRIDKSDNSPLFKADSSFRFLEGPHLMQAENMKEYVLGVKENDNGIDDGYMVNKNGLLINYIHPGLTGEANTVSLESHEEPGLYMRHFDFKVDLEDEATSRSPVTFDQEATYKLCRTDCFVKGHISLEAVNYPGRYLRHSNFRVMMSTNDNTELFKRDSSFKFIDSASYVDAYSYPGYRMDIYNPSEVKLTTTGHELVVVYPGLTNQAGTVSIELVTDRTKYIWVTSDKKLAISDGSGMRQDTFNKRATFFMRDSPWFAKTLAFESAATLGSFISRVDFSLRLRQFENHDGFKSSVSFVRNAHLPMRSVTDLGASLIQSYNYPNYTFGLTFKDQQAFIMTNGKRFIIRSPGLTGQADSISFMSPDRSDTYLRLFGGLLVSENRFNPRNPVGFIAESTFIPRPDKWYPGYFGFESVTKEDAFIRHSGYRLLVSENDDSEIFKKDASFRRIEGPYQLQSLNYPQNKLGLTSNNEALMTPNGHPWYFIHPGLSNDNDSISLESSEQRSSYLRHYNYLLDLENVDKPRNPGIFKQDASFYLSNGKFYDHYLTFEPVNQANHFVRHQNDRVKTAPYEETELFRKDASFRATQGPYLLESYNFQGYGLSVDNKGNFFIGRGGTRLQFITPGLTGQAGTVSIEINEQPGTYLRHVEYLLRADKLAETKDPQKFKGDATWWLREERLFEKTLNLEAVNLPNYFLRHQNYQLKISKDDNTDLFRKDASFSRVLELKPAGDFTFKGPYLLQLFHSPDKFINVAIKPNSNNERRAFLAANRGARFYIQTPGLTGQENTVSFLSADRPDTYLRHHSYILDMESLAGSRNPHIFDLDATFAYLYREDAPDQVLFEPVNYPGYFVSGLNNDLKLVKANGSSTLRDLASFRFAEGPYFLESLLQPNKRLKVTPWSSRGSTGSNMQVTYGGERFYVSTPGLSGVEGTVSLSQTNSPNTHICTSPDKVGAVMLVDRHGVSPTDKVKVYQHCSFKVNHNINYASDKFFAFESSAYDDHYLSLETHDSSRVIIKKSPSGGHIAMDEAGFRTIRGPLQLASYNQDDKSFSIGPPPARQVSLSVNASNLVMVIPGLTGQPGSCSLQVADNRSMYLRHYGYLVDAEDRSNPRNPGIFDKDATFYIKDDMWYEKTLALESVNYGSHYLHHDNLRVRITPADTDNEQYQKDASFIANRVFIFDVEVTTPQPTTPKSPLREGAKAGVAIGTIFLCLLFIVLLLMSGRISAMCCKNRAILRKEGRYDTTDGFDNPIYGSAPQDFTLMYSPQGGVRMMDSTDADKAKANGVKSLQANGYSNQDMADSPGIHSYSGYDDGNVYVEMGTLPRKSDTGRVKPKKKTIPNPMYDTSNQFPGLATQSSVELFVDDHTMDPAAMDFAMADSGLPGMSNTDMMKYVEPATETPNKPDLNPLQEAPLGLQFQPTPPLFLQPPTPDFGNDATDEYIAPTSPIFFGLRPPTGETTSPPVSNGFSSVDLFASPNADVVDESTTAAAVVSTTTGANAGEQASTKQNGSLPATLVPTTDVDDDIPDIIAPPIPTSTQEEEGIYGEVSFSKKTSSKKKDDIKETEDNDDEHAAPPALPPRSYSQEVLNEYRDNEKERIDQQKQPPTEQQKVNIIFDDDPDAIYASIDVEPTYLTAAEVGIVRHDPPPMLPPFPLDAPVADILPPYHSPTTEGTALPAAASLADISNGVLGPKGEIIPLPTRKNSKGNLLDIFSHVFSHEDGDGEKGGGEKKKEKLPISMVNPLYDFEADYSASDVVHQPPESTAAMADIAVPQQVPKEIEVYELDDEEREEEAYKKLVQQKTQEGHLN